ncbi:MAG TPA: hypothetical protein VIL49_05720, partial [Capillimicrobium sp.]
AGPQPRDRLRAAARELLQALGEDVERTWRWVAVWPLSGEPELLRRIAAADAELRAGLESLSVAPDAAARLVRDGWALVHERLWVEAEPDLAGLLAPVMALAALRCGGPAGVRGELAAHAA